MFVNTSIGWLIVTSSILCALYSSHFQQKLKDARVTAIISQLSALTVLKRYGPLSNYVHSDRSCSPVMLLAFAYAIHSVYVSHLCYIVYVVFGEINIGSVTHKLLWASHLSRLTVNSTPESEPLAAD